MDFINLKNPKLDEFSLSIEKGDSLLVEELWDAPIALLATLAKIASKKNVVIITNEKTENDLFDDLPYFAGKEVIEFPSWENLPGDEMEPTSDIVGERFLVLDKLAKAKTPQIVLTSFKACFEKVVAHDKLKSLFLGLKVGDNVPYKTLADYLLEMGYHKTSIVSEKGSFSVRGGIIDIFPASAFNPFRLEFLEDEIVSIRQFDLISQVSVGKVNEILITPNDEFKYLTETTLIDYLDQPLVIFDDVFALEEKWVAFQNLIKVPSKHFCLNDDFFKKIAPLQKIYFISSALESLSSVQVFNRESSPYSDKAVAQEIVFEAFNRPFNAKRWRHPFFPLYPSFCPPHLPQDALTAEDFLGEIFKHDVAIHFLTSVESEERKLKEDIEKMGIAPVIPPTFSKGYLTGGFYIKEPSIALIPMTELTHRYRLRRQQQRSYTHAMPIEMFSLNTGEAVVHMNSGIGRYVGVEKRPNHLGIETEFLLVEYAEGAKLYVPMDQSHLVSKYIGATDEVPKFHTLGSNRWKATLEKSEKAILGYANELLELQAKRSMKEGFACPEDSPLTKQFSDEFPYEETPDQMDAIIKVYQDMMTNRPMDRLVCGDVGYGKTEVAMRAAFKAVVDGGKQVAVLVPTTVLAMQHYETFCERMSGFPIHVGVMSRFRKPKEIKETLAGIENGSVDIVIGTHRVISQDVQFKNLGLIIIDEEQRFGVQAKEHLKKLKTDVDCLTLSATPIPRTLYLSLVGAREMSAINTPPVDRLPIQSFVCQSHDDLIKNALMRELARDGQAYVIHNRVESIYELADRIRKLLPQARVVIGHGQMGADELDNVFHLFKSGKADILVATSIIENGIDIPNANTILIDKADHFGMADLYQMRGRVGRWNKKAYCYFLVRNLSNLSEISRKRLTALTQSAGHGGGMKIALHDLEIRGAGNILGTEQSGHIASIGFTLYCKLLKKTMNALQKKGVMPFTADVKMELPFDARIPDNYIEEVSLRLEVYQRLGDMESEGDIDTLFKELQDRFGKLPLQAEWLYHSARLRLYAARHHFTLIKLTKVVLEAEQMVKKQKIYKKILIQFPKTPQELEERVKMALKNGFTPQSN